MAQSNPVDGGGEFVGQGAYPIESRSGSNNAPLALGGMGLETAGTAAAAHAKALVEARFVMALRNPRKWDEVRQQLMSECRRPSFAHNKSAYYRKPIGAGVEGLGIRFVEVALRCMRNVMQTTTTTYEDQFKRVLKVEIMDLESNTGYDKDITVTKTVERSRVPEGGQALSQRQNSKGEITYLLPATDDDLLNKEGALVSKAVRTLGLRLIPGDLQDEAEDIILSIRKDTAAKDPEGEKKKIIDAFGEIGIKVSSLVDYLGHALDVLTPAELVDLRGLYGALRDGEATWATVMENLAAQRAAKDQSGAGADKTNTTQVGNRLRDKAKAKKEAEAAAAAKAAADAAGSASPQSVTAGAASSPVAGATAGGAGPATSTNSFMAEYLLRIERAAMPDLQALINEISEWKNGEDKNTATRAWNDRLKALKQAQSSGGATQAAGADNASAAGAVDTETGEIKAPVDEAAGT